MGWNPQRATANGLATTPRTSPLTHCLIALANVFDAQGYLPAPSSRRLPTLARKRQEYADAVRLAFSRGVKGLDGPIWHQISIDVPRTNSGVRLWQGEGTQRVNARDCLVREWELTSALTLVVAREDPLRLGDSTPRLWLRAGHQ